MQLNARYPNLFQKATWSSGPTSIQFVSENFPPESLISNVNAVPVTSAGRYVILELADGTLEIPGGTVEQQEVPLDALRRELLEEAGAAIESAEYIGSWQMISQAEKPFRPHLPHPVAYRVVYRCQVTLISKPQIPEDGGELVVAVHSLNLIDAIRSFKQVDRHDLAELYQFSADATPLKEC